MIGPRDLRPSLGSDESGAVLDGQLLLDAVLAHADDDEPAQPVVLAQAHQDMDAVDEQGSPLESHSAGRAPCGAAPSH